GKREMFEGVDPNLEKRYKETDSDYVQKEIEGYMNVVTCPSCKGKRLRPEVLGITFGGKTIADTVGLSIEEANAFFGDLSKLIATLVPAPSVAAAAKGGKSASAKAAAAAAKAASAKGKVKNTDAILTEREAKIAGQALREVTLRLSNLVE